MPSVAKKMKQTSQAEEWCIRHESYRIWNDGILAVILCFVDHVEVPILQKKLSTLQQERDSLQKQVNGLQVQVFKLWYFFNVLKCKDL